MTLPLLPEALDILVEIASLLNREGSSEAALQVLDVPLSHPSTRHLTKEKAIILKNELVDALPTEKTGPLSADGNEAYLQAIAAKLFLEPS
jgi:SAM-dependent MidA family methyltransferase